jgi:hypothetical protein
VKQNIDYLQFLTTHRKVNVKEELAWIRLHQRKNIQNCEPNSSSMFDYIIYAHC